MPPPPHASIGIALDEVDTPALVLDLDALGRNVLRMADAVKSSGVRLRPSPPGASRPAAACASPAFTPTTGPRSTYAGPRTAARRSLSPRKRRGSRKP